MRIIELCGNPGVGKSTIAESLINHLKAEGYSVIDTRRPYANYQGTSRFLVKNKIAIMYRLDGRARKLFRLLRGFTQNNKVEQNNKWASNFQRLAYVFSWASDKCDYLVVDEGPIQYLTSFFFESEIEEIPKKVKKEILSYFYGFEYEVFSVVTSIEESMKRIKKRNRSNDRFNTESIDAMTLLLKKKNANIQKIIESLELENVCTIDNSSENFENAVLCAMRTIHRTWGHGYDVIS